MAELGGDPARVEELFTRVTRETLQGWLPLAEERLPGTGTVCLLAPGNDDPPFVDEVLRSSSLVINPEGQLVELPGGFSMVSVGSANPTPWVGAVAVAGATRDEDHEPAELAATDHRISCR